MTKRMLGKRVAAFMCPLVAAFYSPGDTGWRPLMPLMRKPLTFSSKGFVSNQVGATGYG